jgi:hypothetical protein
MQVCARIPTAFQSGKLNELEMLVGMMVAGTENGGNYANNSNKKTFIFFIRKH